MQAIESDKLPFKADAAIAPHLRVKIGSDSEHVAIAGDEACIGTAYNRAYAAEDGITVRDKRSPGTHVFVAGGAIAAGAQVTSAAGGKVVTGTAGTEDYGVALTAATGDGGLIEVLTTT